MLFFSCARTLANKYGSTVAKVIKKYGLDFAKGEKKGIALIKPTYYNDLGINRFATGNNREPLSYIAALFAAGKSMASLNNLSCAQCGSNHKVEMHHIRALKDLKPEISHVDKLMSKARRKQIPLCRVCHMDTHHPSRLNRKDKNIRKGIVRSKTK